MFGLGISEVAIIGVVLLLVFGPRRLPEVGEGLGKAITNFRWSLKQLHEGDSARRDVGDP